MEFQFQAKFNFIQKKITFIHFIKHGHANTQFLLLIKHSKGVVLHISASKIKFLEVAEEMEIQKSDKNGQIREFTVTDLDEFLPSGMRVEDLLTVAERQTIIRHELETIRALAEDDHIPGYPPYTLYEGQSILHVCLQYKLIKNMYPLHDQEALKKLGKKWYLSLFRKQPFGK